MSTFRPEALALLAQMREPALGGLVLAMGLWVASQGGWIPGLAGGAAVALGAGWTLLALRRMRFAPDISSPGLVEVDEGRVTYMGPRLGGSVGLPDLVEIRLLTLRGRRVWRLKQADGDVLLVPLDATGAERLFDAFAALPGLSSADLVTAIDPPAALAGSGLEPANRPQDRLVWRRSGPGIAPR